MEAFRLWRAIPAMCSRKTRVETVTEYCQTSGTEMERSIKRILTTHVGSLIRPRVLQEILRAKRSGDPINGAEYAECLRYSVTEVVRQPLTAGIDIVDDGEY